MLNAQTIAQKTVHRAKHQRVETEDRLDEWARCAADIVYWIERYVKIYDAEARNWIPFTLWPEQKTTLLLAQENQLLIALKPRQVGLTWLFLAFAAHEAIFRPIANILLFSKRDDEAVALLAEERLRGLLNRLPDWMRPGCDATSAHLLKLSNGSTIRALPTTAGDSYTATFALIDEADLIPDLPTLMGRVKPTIEAGGKLVLISRVDKSRPQSRFKQIYKAAKSGTNGWAHIFLPWWVHPDRDQAWYEQKCAEALENSGSLDEVHEQYPATDTQALAGKSVDRRLPSAWLDQCYVEKRPMRYLPPNAPAIDNLRIYRLPEPGHKYAIGIDPAEGNPTSDDSAFTVEDCATGEEVAHLSGKYQPEVIAAHADAVGTWYNHASIMPERNNHGHAVILWFKDHGECKVATGWDGKEGWLSNSRGKALLYDGLAKRLREQDVLYHTFKTRSQLGSIMGATLRAPEGEMDDAADSAALADAGRNVPEARFDVW